ncbi:hypothetical protein CXB51_002801 [Gossypium anomalum]|uniref:Uncharacterized protein n=1 Tax=Gossypium anomalum TaxID=47600 RepID=A0A8J5Z4Z3_9ROSI|nr:hypothetical protein CXB51_002801 [Gossypium anomalum]
MFYNGVNPSTRQMIDAAAGGTINNKTLEEVYEFIEEMSLNNYQWQLIRTKPTKTVGVYNVNSFTMLTNQEKKPNLEEMLSKFISVSETRFQNTKTAFKNQQILIQWLETQIGQLSKLISERPQGSLPSNTEPNPREQLNPINVQDKEGFVEPEPELMQETVVSKGKCELSYNENKMVDVEYKPRVPYPNATRKDRSDK